MRTPIFLCDLDPAKLRKAASGNTNTKNTYYYDDVTIDPRYEELGPAEQEQRQTTTKS